MSNRWTIVALVALALAPCESPAIRIHRSFRPRGFGFGGGAGVIVPVDSRIAAALDEGRAKAARRARVYVGRVTSVSAGDALCVVTDGGTRVPVRLDLIEAPAADKPIGKASAEFLKKLVQGRQVRVEYHRRDKQGRVIGVVTCGKTVVNLQMVSAGQARYAGEADKTSPYVVAEAAAQAGNKGIWASEEKGFGSKE